jgi:ketol-acid reductoisomerase
MLRRLNKLPQKINSQYFKSKLLKYSIPSCENEYIYENSFDSRKKAQWLLDNHQICVLGYGSQGRAQSLNLKDSGCRVLIGVRKYGNSWNNAISDGFIPDESLFDIDEAVGKGAYILNLLSDAGQINKYDTIKSCIDEKSTLCYSHGFNVVYNEKTKFNYKDFPQNDIIMIAPKGSGKSVRDKYLDNTGINSSFAIYQDKSGFAKNKALSIGFLIGSPYIYETTFKNEVYSDLTGERSILMGGIAGLFKAQYDVLRENGHSPSEAYNETVEEALASLYPLIHKNGMDNMFRVCSTTAQRGALDWRKEFEKINKPLIQEIYNKVKSGHETQNVIDANSNINYREKLEIELEQLNNEEIWQVGKEIRKLRK